MLNASKAKKIIQNSDLSDSQGVGKSLKYATSSKNVRLNTLRRDPSSQDGQICAAIEIQRIFRGYCTRCQLFHTLQPVLSNTAVYSASKHELTRLEDFKASSQPEVRERMNVQYERFLKMRKHKKSSSGLGALDSEDEKVPTFEDFCIGYIQDWWQARKTFARPSYSVKSSLLIRPPSKIHEPPPITRQKAATMIQRAWRRHIDSQVFRYYRDLINFRQRGDPAMMLRCINPMEAKYLDPAAGIHIKFRLAGESFPPNIYYKIFTHRPIQDLCANSPKDYTQPDAKLRTAKDVHNKQVHTPGTAPSRWYKRWENNGWRLVSDRILQSTLSDNVTWETSKKKSEFHHNKLLRKQDFERKKKQKKIVWMQKMYKEGMLKAKTDDAETIHLIESATAGMVETVKRYGPESVQEWEVDELLEWTTNLNFDEYLLDWKEYATSANSEKPIMERMNLMTNAADPYEFSVSAVRCEGSLATVNSHNTPVSNQSVATL